MRRSPFFWKMARAHRISPRPKLRRLLRRLLARRIAAQQGLDLAAGPGSGPHGRIVKADVEGASAAPKAAAPAAAPAAAATPADAPTGPSTDIVLKTYEGRPFTEVKLDGMRKTIATRLSEAKQTVPHFYLRRDIELDAPSLMPASRHAA